MSDGSTQTVTSGKGQDGKDGTEWTIGEDGFWYKDGEKTENQAIGQNGATAPSPQINTDGYWVLYEWDETTGEFVEKVTEIPAQGTGAYYVEKMVSSICILLTRQVNLLKLHYRQLQTLLL